MIDILLFVLFFALSYFLVMHINVKIKTDKYNKRNNLNVSTKDYSFEELFSKFNFLKAKDNFLSKQGYPLNLNAISYYLIKVSLTFILFTAGIINYNSLPISIVFALIGYFLIDFYLMLNKKERDSERCVDLLNVVDELSLRLESFIVIVELFLFGISFGLYLFIV